MHATAKSRARVDDIPMTAPLEIEPSPVGIAGGSVEMDGHELAEG